MNRRKLHRTLEWIVKLGPTIVCSTWAISCSGPSAEVAGGRDDVPDAGDSHGDQGNDDDRGDEGDQNGTRDGGESVCASVKAGAQIRQMPIDVILVVDNSISMSEEIASVRRRVADDFLSVLDPAGVDYRLILVSRYGDIEPDDSLSNPQGERICIGSPLSSRDCDGADDLSVANGPRFFHYSAQVESTDAWCILLESFTKPDEFVPWDAPDYARPRAGWQVAAPDGWRAFLRSEAFKSIVVVSDDGVQCPTAQAVEESGGWWYDYLEDIGRIEINPMVVQHPEFFSDQAVELGLTEQAAVDRFDRALTSLSPLHFGTPAARNYRYHSIVGLEAERLMLPSQPLEQRRCATASGAGVGHQLLSMLTGGLRYSACRADSYGEAFRELAQDAIRTSQLSCTFDIPASPDERVFDLTRVNLEYTSDQHDSRLIPAVPTASDCGEDDGWYYDDPASPTSVTVCPRTCATFRDDPSGQVDLAFGCATVTLL